MEILAQFDKEKYGQRLGKIFVISFKMFVLFFWTHYVSLGKTKHCGGNLCLKSPPDYKIMALKGLQVHGKNVKFSKSFDEIDLRDSHQILSLAISDFKRIH